MPKTAISDQSKINQILREFPEEFSCTPSTQLFCQTCNIIVKHEKKHFVTSHRASAKHSTSSRSRSNMQQTFIEPPIVPDFDEKVVWVPTPVVTRWGTWLDAAINYYACKLPEVRNIVESFQDDGSIVSKVKDAAKKIDLEIELCEISRCYSSLLTLFQRVESSSYSIVQAYSDIQNLDFKEDKCGIQEYLRRRLFDNDFLEIVNCTRRNIPPGVFAKLQECCATSCAIERSFSQLKKLLCKDRNFLPENLPKYFIFYFNNCQSEN